MRDSSKRGVTLIEMLIATAILSGIMVIGASTMMGFVYRFAADIRLDRTERAANRVMAEFSAAMKSAIGYAIYPDAATWRSTAPTLQGNFLLITKPDGGKIGFAFASGEIQIIDDPGGTNQVLICNRSAAPTAAFASLKDGIPTLAWTVNLPAEQVQLQSCAQPLYMQ